MKINRKDNLKMRKILTFIMSLAIAGSVCMFSGFADNVSAESVGVEDPVQKAYQRRNLRNTG